MAKAKKKKYIQDDASNPLGSPADENRGLLSDLPSDNYDDNYDDNDNDKRNDIDHETARPNLETALLTSHPDQNPRSSQTSLTTRSPRTPNRVRFDLPPIQDDAAEQHSPPPPYIDGNQRSTLLSQIEPPSVVTSWNDEDILPWAQREHRRPKSGLRSAFMNMANSIIGAGIIGQPYAFRQAGLLAGIMLLIMLTIMVDWTIGLIVINSKLSGSLSFQGTVEHCFGRVGLITISLAQWAFAFGGMVAFGIIVGDTIPHVVLALWPTVVDVPVLNLLANRQLAIAIFVIGISYPLSLYRDIAKLAKASTLAFFSMMIILLAVVSQAPSVPPESRGTLDKSIFSVQDGVFQAISVISFALVCHHNSLLIYESLKTPTIDRFARVTHYSTTVSMLACLLMALAGFLTFGSLTQGNVLNNFPADNTLINIARLCFGLNMLTTLPLEAFVCREVILNYWFLGKPFNIYLHLAITTSLVFSTMILSLMTCDLGVVFELIGAVSACALAYILPPLCFLKLSTRSWKTIPAIFCVAFGILVMVISLFQTVSKTIRHEVKTVSCL